MNRILNILKWEFMVRFRSKIFLISLFMPLILVVFSIVPAMLMEKGGDSEVKVGIVNHAGHITTDFKLNIERKYRLDDEKPKYWFFDYENFDEAKAGLLKKTLDVVMVIPAGIMDTANAEFYARSLSNFKVMDELRNTLSHTVILMRMSEQGVAVEMAESISKRVRMDSFEINKEGELTEGNELMVFLGPFLFVFLLVMAVFINGQLLLRSVIEERTNRMVEILLSTVSARELMTGKILGLGLLGMVQILFYLAMGIVFGMVKGIEIVRFDELPILFMYFLTGYFFFAAIYATLGTLFDNEQDAQQSMSIVSLIAMVPLMGSFYFMANPTALVTKILSFVPPMTPFMMILRISSDAAEPWEVAATIVLMILSVWGMMTLAGKIFRTALLMYGKRATLPEIWRWIRA
ncbi:MAG: ABC transporter permease [Candidatus Marinimicrobia bacterium]|jgi:ABC-2 type transport system permease protein|nr:ABC transporter permease [Candidatus Neomarinimicrobiota bacterium]MDP6229537.1 ABC transporter permease [Candidatus Neomarinimicrobiota bacterium]